MQTNPKPTQNSNAIIVVAVMLILFKTATAMAIYQAACGCKTVPSYVAESCAAGDWVFDGFRVCCNFLGRVSVECLTAYLPEFAAAGVGDFSIFNGCSTLLLSVRHD